MIMDRVSVNNGFRCYSITDVMSDEIIQVPLVCAQLGKSTLKGTPEVRLIQ